MYIKCTKTEAVDVSDSFSQLGHKVTMFFKVKFKLTGALGVYSMQIWYFNNE